MYNSSTATADCTRSAYRGAVVEGKVFVGSVLIRKLTTTLCNRKVFSVVVAASSPRALVASSNLALGWVRAADRAYS